jgi:hypothetical protein
VPIALAPAFDYGAMIVDGDLYRLAKVGHLHVLQFDLEISGNGRSPSEQGNAVQQAGTSIRNAGYPDRGNLQRATQLVHDERGERLIPNISCDYEQRLAGAADLLQQRKQILLELIFFS